MQATVCGFASVIVYTNHICDFPPSWVSCYRTLELTEAIPLGATFLGYPRGSRPQQAKLLDGPVAFVDSSSVGLTLICRDNDA